MALQEDLQGRHSRVRVVVVDHSRQEPVHHTLAGLVAGSLEPRVEDEASVRHKRAEAAGLRTGLDLGEDRSLGHEEDHSLGLEGDRSLDWAVGRVAGIVDSLVVVVGSSLVAGAGVLNEESELESL